MICDDDHKGHYECCCTGDNIYTITHHEMTYLLKNYNSSSGILQDCDFKRLFKGAIRENHVDVVKQMIVNKMVDPSKGYNFNFGDFEYVHKSPKLYPIAWASRMGHIDIVKLLLEDERVDPSANNNEAIRWVSSYGLTEIVRLLLTDGRVDPSAVGNEMIIHASRYKYTDIVKLLLEDPRVDPSDDDNAAIRLASDNGYVDIMRLLMSDPRVDPSTRDNLAIKIACNDACNDAWTGSEPNKYTNVVRLLLSDHRTHKCEDEFVSKQLEWINNILHLLENSSEDHRGSLHSCDVENDQCDVIPPLARMVTSYIIPRCQVIGCKWKY